MREIAADAFGWSVTLALAISKAWPYGIAGRATAKLQPHFWLGYALPAAALAHGWFTMKSGQARRASAIGALLGTRALVPLVSHVLIGRTLRGSAGVRRESARHRHFVTRVVIVLLVAPHRALPRW